MAKEKPKPTFLVRFVGDDVTPETIPLRAVSDALSAVQDIASARDSFETPHVPPEKTIGLLDVERGSAVYRCVARSPQEATHNLRRMGSLLSSKIESEADSELLVAVMRPLAALSHVAKTVKCRVEIDLLQEPNAGASFSVEEDDYKRLSKSLLLKGDTTIVGKIVRVGGATGMRCLLRVPGRRRLLYCDVQNRALVRRLGQHLYEDIAATGAAVWIHRSWMVYKFKIRDFAQPRLGNGNEALDELRGAGLSAWDNIKDPAAFIEEMRE